jgi:hypothetical protein
MKNFRKIIGLFLIIFLCGVLITIGSVNATLNKESSQKEIVEIKKDTTHLITAKKEAV